LRHLFSWWGTLKKNSSEYTWIALRMLNFLKKKCKNRPVPSVGVTPYHLLVHGCYPAHPLGFSRRVGPKDLKSWYSQFSCLIFSNKRMMWSIGVARSFQWGIGDLGAEHSSPKARGSRERNPQL